MTTRLLLARHGETDAAVSGRTQGRIDNPLNARGVQQARVLAARLGGERPTALYSSPASRALATAGPLAAALGLAIRTDTRLLEMDYGALDDLTGVELRARHPEFMVQWADADPSHLRMPGGETLAEAQQRVLDAIGELEQRHYGEVVAVFSHGFALRALLCHVLGLPLRSFRQIRLDLAAVSIVDVVEGQRVVVQLNESCHLDV